MNLKNVDGSSGPTVPKITARETARAQLLQGITAHRDDMASQCAALQEQAQAMLNDALDEVENGYVNGAEFVGFYSQVAAVLQAEDRLKVADRCVALISG